MTKKQRAKAVVLSVLLVIEIALAIFVLVWFTGAHYSVFDKVAQKREALPDLADGFCPQGSCALPANEGGYTVAVSGYYKHGVPSRVYLLGGGEPAYITLEKDGAALDAHFGGVAATEEYLYVTNDAEIVRVPLSAVYAGAKTGGSVAVTDGFKTGLQNAFCSVYNDTLFAGEFYRAGNYETDKDHHITNESGETNRAFVYCYKMDESKPYGVEITTPYATLSVRGLVQGVAVTDEHIYLSCSWGLADSKLYCYTNPLGGAADMEDDVYFLGADRLISTITAPCMSEGIFIRDGGVNILFESGTNKYKQFVRRKTKTICSVPFSAFEK